MIKRWISIPLVSLFFSASAVAIDHTAIGKDPEAQIIDNRVCVPYKVMHRELKKEPVQQGLNLAVTSLAFLAGYSGLQSGVNPSSIGLQKNVFLLSGVAIYYYREYLASLVDYLIEHSSYNPPIDCYSNSTQLLSNSFVQEISLQLNESSTCDVDKEDRPVLLPVLNAAVSGSIHLAVNTALEMGFKPKISDNQFTMPGLLALGFKSIALTSGMEAQLNKAIRNYLLNTFEIETSRAQAIASTATSTALVGAVATGSVLGMFNKQAAASPRAAGKFLPYLSGKLPQAMSVTAAYAFQSAVENACLSYVSDQFESEDEKRSFCTIATSGTLWGMITAGFLRDEFGAGFTGVFTANLLEAVSLSFTHMLINIGRSWSDDPLTSDTYGIIAGGAFMKFLQGFDSIIAKTYLPNDRAISENTLHGAGLILLIEASSALVSHAYAHRPVSMGGLEWIETDSGGLYCLPEGSESF